MLELIGAVGTLLLVSTASVLTSLLTTSSILIGGFISTLFVVDFPGPAEVGAETALVLFSAMILFLGTGELLPEGVALFPGPSSQESVEEPDSSSEDKVGG